MVDFPQNDFTRMMEAVRAQNQSGVRAGGVASALPLPTVRSADLGQEVQNPLTFEEREELDAQARAAGILDPSLGNVSPETGAAQYATLEEAMAAGSPVAGATLLTSDPVTARMRSPRGQQFLQQFIPQFAAAPSPMRMPDFKRVQYIDLEHGFVVVDGMEFPMPEEDVREHKQYAITRVMDVINEKITEALGLLSTPPAAEEKDGQHSGTD